MGNVIAIDTFSKKCCQCGETKFIDNFYYNKKASDGCSTYCKKCQNIASNKAKLKYRYKITLKQYNSMLKNQNNCCYLCNEDLLIKSTKEIHIDHDAITGKVYGVCCRRCNVSIGQFNHDPELILRIAENIKMLRK